MSASINLIAEDGHVLTPRLKETGVEMERIGIHDASTFPGFCERHEEQFAEFEIKKQMSAERHYLLQTFRTLCREIFRLRHQKTKLEAELDGYRDLRREFVAARIRQVRLSKPVEVSDVSFENDNVETRVVEAIGALSEDLRILDLLYQGLSEDIREGSTKSAVPVIVRAFNLRLPVCLSGLGVLNYVEQRVVKRALCLLAVIPEQQETKIIIAATEQHVNALTAYCSDESSTGLLAMIESWMCHGSDHWFMTPSGWFAIPEPRRKLILDQILDANPSIADPVNFSILDNARVQIVELMERALSADEFSPDELSAVKELLASEKKKLGAP